jgi:hypothetical protein
MAISDPTLTVPVSTSGVRIDVVTVTAAGLSAILVIGLLKILAIHHSNHPVAQGFLVLF